MSHEINQLNLWPQCMNDSTLSSQNFENRNIEGANEIVCQTLNICVQLRHLCFIGWPQLRLLLVWWMMIFLKFSTFHFMMDQSYFSQFFRCQIWGIEHYLFIMHFSNFSTFLFWIIRLRITPQSCNARKLCVFKVSVTAILICFHQFCYL